MCHRLLQTHTAKCKIFTSDELSPHTVAASYDCYQLPRQSYIAFPNFSGLGTRGDLICFTHAAVTWRTHETDRHGDNWLFSRCLQFRHNRVARVRSRWRQPHSLVTLARSKILSVRSTLDWRTQHSALTQRFLAAAATRSRKAGTVLPKLE